jgi:hypothetical protein
LWAVRELEDAWCEEMLPVRGARSEVWVVIGSSRSSRVAVKLLGFEMVL